MEKEAEAERGQGEGSCICRVSKIEICGADVWTGHSRWLFPCSLHIPCLFHLYPSHLTDLPRCLPQAPGVACSFERGSEGHPPFPGNK